MVDATQGTRRFAITDPASSSPARRAPRLRDWLDRRRHPSVRARVVASVLIMSTLGLAMAGAVANAIQTARILEQIDLALSQEVEELRALAADGVDPTTGRAFTSVEQLMIVALKRNVPHPNEAFLSYHEGAPHKVSPGGLQGLVSSPAIHDAVRDVPQGARTVIRTEVVTDLGRVRLAIVPVAMDTLATATPQQEPDQGTYVVAYAVDRELAPQSELMKTYSIVAVSAILLVGAVGWLVAGRLLRPLRLLRDATSRIGQADLSQRVAVNGHDDVSELAKRFNEMVGRLETAFRTQREFLDDAGHELRTPITILRGHLEVLDEHDPDDVRDTRVLLLDELDRMSRLVDDLVLLAKAERSDFVRPTRIHIDRFTDDVFDKARALGDRAWILEARAEAVVIADPQRLTQAALQLADNAVKYTKPGATVALGSRADSHEVAIWVRDTGPGIAPEERHRVFDRFTRGTSARGIEGSGLGLAIVRAISEAHGGRVELSSGRDAGVTFTIVIPRHPTPTPTGERDLAGPKQTEREAKP